MKTPARLIVKSLKPDVLNQMRVGHLRREASDHQEYLDSLNAALLPEYPQRLQWYKLVKSAMQDGHLDMVADKRIRAVTTSRIVIPGYENTSHEQDINAPWMKTLMRQLMLYRINGFRVVQILPSIDPVKRFEVKLIPLHHVDHERGIVTKYPGSGVTGWSWLEGDSEPYLFAIGEPGYLGKMPQLIPYVIYKRNNWGDWADSNERHGMPTRVYEYDPMRPGDRDTIKKQADEQGSAGYIVVPKGTIATLLESNSASGQGNAHKPFHDTMNNEITLNLLGQLLTTNSDGKGSYALGMVHQAVEQGVNLEDKLWCLDEFNYNIAPKLGRLGLILPGHIQFDDTVKLTQKERAEILGKAKDLVPLSEDQIREDLNLDEPTPEERERWEEARKTPKAQEVSEGNPSPSGEVAEGRRGSKKKADTKLTEAETSLPLPGGVAEGRGGLSIALQHHFGNDSNLPLTGSSAKFDEILLSSSPSRGGAQRAEGSLTTLIDRIIADIHSGKLKTGDVDRELVSFYADLLFTAVQEGYGQQLASLTSGSDHKMLTALKGNIFKFSTHKSFHFIQEAFGQLVEGNEVKTFTQFRREVLAIHNDYNVNWLRTEYNVAVGNGRMASIEQELQANKADLPLAQLRVVMDDRTRHGKLNKITLPVDHKAWAWLTPLLGYGCRCNKIALASGTITPNADLPSKDIVPKAFQFNPGTDRMVFSKQHPYFTVPHGHKTRAKKNFGLVN